MKNSFNSFHIIWAIALCAWQLPAQTAISYDEADIYNVSNIPTPDGVILEVGGLATLPDGRLAVSTRRGDVFMIENPDMRENSRPRFTKYAEGLHEVLGLAYKEGNLYCVQRGELTRLVDSNKDGKVDTYEAVYSWPISGNYHEFAFGPKIDKDGNFYITLNVGFNSEKGKWYEATSKQKYGGWLLKISPEGKVEPWSVGHRSPCGIFIHPVTGDIFYTENQGDWVGSGGITHCEKGDFVGNPAGLVWTKEADSPIKLSHEEFCRITKMCTDDEVLGIDVTPDAIPDIGEPMFEMVSKIPKLKTQAVTLPHSVMGQSTSDMIYLYEGNKIAPHFAGQVLVGDQFASKIMRVSFEKVKGVTQGAAFDFRKDFASGVLRFAWSNEGALFVGQTSRGWGSIGKFPFGLQRMVWTGKKPFEIKDIKAKPDGFELEFTHPVDQAKASDAASYAITGFTYKYHSRYGSPIIRDKKLDVQGAVVSEDGLKVRLVIDGLREGFVHEVKASGVVAKESKVALQHNVGYYTLNRIPDGEKLVIVKSPKKSGSVEKPITAATPAKAAVQPPKPSAKPTGPIGKTNTKQPATWGSVDKVINIATKPGLMYDLTKISIKAGSKIKLVFNNNDDMQHNVVVVKPGKADEIGETATNMGLEGPKMNYVPKSDDVLYHTKLVSPGNQETIYFEAPKTPGNYQLVCTYPGHYATMQAILTVTP